MRELVLVEMKIFERKATLVGDITFECMVRAHLDTFINKPVIIYDKENFYAPTTVGRINKVIRFDDNSVYGELVLYKDKVKDIKGKYVDSSLNITNWDNGKVLEFELNSIRIL